MKRAVLYCRVAHDDDHALDSQEELLRMYCVGLKAQVVECIKDIGSGLSLDREGIQSLRALAQAQAMDEIVILEVSRLTRKTEDLVSFAKEMEGLGVGIASEKDGILASVSPIIQWHKPFAS